MTKISPKTQEIIDAIEMDTSEYISAVGYTWAFQARANVSAAFRIAKKRGIIRVRYVSAAGSPVYVNRNNPEIFNAIAA